MISGAGEIKQKAVAEHKWGMQLKGAGWQDSLSRGRLELKPGQPRPPRPCDKFDVRRGGNLHQEFRSD